MRGKHFRFDFFERFSVEKKGYLISLDRMCFRVDRQASAVETSEHRVTKTYGANDFFRLENTDVS